jgi:hypothetical protein
MSVGEAGVRCVGHAPIALGPVGGRARERKRFAALDTTRSSRFELREDRAQMRRIERSSPRTSPPGDRGRGEERCPPSNPVRNHRRESARMPVPRGTQLKIPSRPGAGIPGPRCEHPSRSGTRRVPVISGALAGRFRSTGLRRRRSPRPIHIRSGSRTTPRDVERRGWAPRSESALASNVPVDSISTDRNRGPPSPCCGDRTGRGPQAHPPGRESAGLAVPRARKRTPGT